MSRMCSGIAASNAEARLQHVIHTPEFLISPNTFAFWLYRSFGYRQHHIAHDVTGITMRRLFYSRNASH